MELDILFWIAIAAIYILQSLASKRRKPDEAIPGQEASENEELPTDLQQALGEIGRVLRGEPTEAQRLPEPHYDVESARPSEPVRQPVPQKAPSSSRKPAKPPFYDNLKSSPVFYDQAFEEQTTDTFAAPVITHDHEFSFQDPDKSEQGEKGTAAPDLKDHMVSRQAFIAAEVLAPPLSKRHGRR